jgi:hypothetical protein
MRLMALNTRTGGRGKTVLGDTVGGATGNSVGVVMVSALGDVVGDPVDGEGKTTGTTGNGAIGEFTGVGAVGFFTRVGAMGFFTGVGAIGVFTGIGAIGVVKGIGAMGFVTTIFAGDGVGDFGAGGVTAGAI